MDERSVVHLHIGVDKVFEELFDVLFETRILNSQNARVAYVSPDAYRSHIRPLVDAASPPLSSFSEDKDQYDTFVSRPRMIFNGAPMNCSETIRNQLYKLEHLQAIFENRMVVFHLLLTDHVSYLYNHRKSMDASPDVEPSWTRLIEAVSSKVRDGNVLRVWNAEEIEIFLPPFLSSVFKMDATAIQLVMRSAPVKLIEAPMALDVANFAHEFGLDQDELDFLYESEVSLTVQHK